MNQPVLFVYRKMKENDKVSRAKNPKYESMSPEELKANMEKSRQELEVAIHNKNLLEQRKKVVERRERSHRLIVKGAEFEKAFPLSRDLEQEEFQEVMNQMRNSSYNKSVVRQNYIAASQKDRQEIAEAVKKKRREMTANGTVSFFSKTCIQREMAKTDTSGRSEEKREKQVNFPVFHGVQTEGILEENGKAEQQPVKQSEQKPEKKTSLLKKLDEKKKECAERDAKQQAVKKKRNHEMSL